MKKIYSFICVSLLTLLALNVSARDIYVDQAAGDNLTGAVGDATKPYKDLSYVLYKTTVNDGGELNVTTWLKTLTFGQVATNGDKIYIVGNYNLMADMAYYIPANHYSYKKDNNGNVVLDLDDNGDPKVDTNGNAQGFWFRGEYLVNGNDIYNIIGDGNTVISCADAAWITANPDVVGGLGRAIAGQGGFGVKFQDLRFEHCGWASGSSGDRAPFFMEHNQVGVTFENCVFTKNKIDQSQNGGPSSLIAATNVILNFTNCQFYNNSATNGMLRYSGGGNYATESPLRPVVIDGCTFENNTTTNGDGGVLRLGQNWDTTIRNTAITNNFCQNQGGAIFVENINHNITLDNVTITDNKGSQGGGITMKASTDKTGDKPNITADGVITIKNSTIANNTTTGRGGGVVIHDSRASQNLAVNFDNTIFTGNSAQEGGGFFVGDSPADLNFTNCQFLNNTAKYGGGFYMNGNDGSFVGTIKAELKNCVFAENAATDGVSGSGIAYKNDKAMITTNLSIANSTFYAQSGGAIHIENGVNNTESTFSLTNSTLVGNGRGLVIGNNVTDMEKMIDGCIFSNTQNDLTSDSAGDAAITVTNSFFKTQPNANVTLAEGNTSAANILFPTGEAAKFYLEKLGTLPMLAGSDAISKGDAVGVAIMITSESSATVEQGNSFTVTAVSALDALIAAGDETIDATAYTIENTPVATSEGNLLRAAGEVPDGVSIDPVTGELTVGEATPPEGSYSFDIVATDAAGTAYRQTFSLTVTPAQITGIDNAVADKVAVSVEYFDLTGKPVPADTKGLVVKKTVYEDGSISHSKAIVK